MKPIQHYFFSERREQLLQVGILCLIGAHPFFKHNDFTKLVEK